MGFMPAAIIAIALFLTQTGEAKPIPYRNSTKGANSTLIMGVGSSGFRTAGAVPGGGPGGGPPGPGPGGAGQAAPVASRPDTLYIIYMRNPSEKEKMVLGKDFEGERMTMGVYKSNLNEGITRMGDTKLAFVREVSYDARLFGIDPETVHQVKEIKKAFEEEAKKGDKGKDE
jgi:hypothetical protein